MASAMIKIILLFEDDKDYRKFQHREYTLPDSEYGTWTIEFEDPRYGNEVFVSKFEER